MNNQPQHPPPTKHPGFARIAVNVPHVQGNFDYHIPGEIAGKVIQGQLVEVPFGRQNVQGVIIEFPKVPAVPQTKAVEKVLDPIPVVTPHQIELAHQISRDTLSPIGVTLTAMVPAGLSVQADVLYQLTERALKLQDSGHPVLDDPSPSQLRLLDILFERGPLRGRQLDRALPHMNWRRTAGYLTRRGILQTESSLADPSVKPKVERRLRFIGDQQLASEEMDKLAQKRFPEALARRQAVLRMIIEADEPIPLSILYKKTDANLTDIQTLVKRGLGELTEAPVIRDPLEGIVVEPSTPPLLTEDQTKVWQPIQSTMRQKASEVFLLQGVTGSGKTEIYLRAAEEAIALGRQVIVLVPEIALTPQTVTRFMSRFPDRVGVLHSELSPGERFDTWRLARHGALDIVVGPRSALFSPLPDPGLIVVDECHDDSYYQGDLSPRYHAREAAIQYGKITNAVCIIGSATPDVTSAYSGSTGKYHFLSLPRRILAHKETIREQIKFARQEPEFSRYRDLDDQLQTADLPEVEVIDMRQELKKGNRSIFSQALQSSLEERLNRNQQAILFMNRRGSATYVFCRDCGYALRCPRCGTSLTAHQGAGELRCHICSYKRQIPKTCPECGSSRIRQLGTGTQQVETVLKEQFPDVRTLRWDRDTTQKKGAHWEIMDSFSSHKADVLIGTQMLAKGLDLPLVTLVGIILADSGLHLPDFRAAERTFQVLTQVAGRAGRSPLGGNVILQTFEPDHFVIQAAAGHDYEDFYQQELEFRRELGYPPFQRLIRLEIRDQDLKKAEKKARTFSTNLAGWIKEEGYRSTQIVGPTPAYFNRIRGEWRWQILVKGPNPLALVRDHHPGAEWIVEVDPPVIL